jgi:fructose-bisphosphate aldolase, class II
MVKSLRETILDAENKQIAIGHFNISDSEAMNAIFNVAKKLNVPVIIGVSEGERDFIGIPQVVAIVKKLREEFSFPIYLNADHTYSFLRVKEAIDAGFDAVIFDGAKLSFEENVEVTKKCVDYARKISEETGRDILVEGELGFIGTSSKILDSVPEGVSLLESSLTNPQKAKEFVEKTGVDLLAPAVGNFHGMLRGGVDPKLNIKRIKEIKEIAGVPLVLHGGSGNSNEDFIEAIKNGVSVVHINTELRKAYREGIKKSLSENPEEVAPYKFMKEGMEAIEEVVERDLKLFNFLV